MTETRLASGSSMGNGYPKGNYLRCTLSPQVAAVLEQAHRSTGASYRRVAAALGFSHPFWWRLCRGERAPSLLNAFRIIDFFGFDDETAVKLLDESVGKPDSR